MCTYIYMYMYIVCIYIYTIYMYVYIYISKMGSNPHILLGNSYFFDMYSHISGEPNWALAGRDPNLAWCSQVKLKIKSWRWASNIGRTLGIAH